MPNIVTVISLLSIFGLFFTPLMDNVFATPASNMRITDSYGNSLDAVKVGEQVMISYDLKIRDHRAGLYISNPYHDKKCHVDGLEINCVNAERHFTAIFQIQDHNNKVIQISWLDGEIVLDQYMTIKSSWIPEEVGRYTVTQFTWDSLENPTAIAPSVGLTFSVT